MKLKPCPFCGEGRGSINFERYDYGEGFEVSCTHCRGHLNDLFSTFDEAKEAWNTRSLEDALRSALQELVTIASQRRALDYRRTTPAQRDIICDKMQQTLAKAEEALHG